MDPALTRFTETFGPDALREVSLRWVPSVVAALLAVFIFWFLIRFTLRGLAGAFERSHMDATAAKFVLAVVRFVLLTIGALTVLGQLGVDTTSVLASVGVLGLTFGFAAQNTLSNVISGLFIFWDRPFVIGDLIEVGDLYGVVKDITLRSTRVVTPDGRMVAIPNSAIAEASVASYTNFPHLRLDIQVTVGVRERIGHCRELLLGLVKDQPQFMSDPPAEVVVKALNDYNMLLELRVWLRDEKKHVAERFALRERVKDVLDANGVEMPFQTFSLTPVEVRRGAAG